MPDVVRAWVVTSPRPAPTAAELDALAGWAETNHRLAATAYALCGPPSLAAGATDAGVAVDAQ